MAGIQAVDLAQATGRTKELLDAVEAKMGRVPNMFKLLANSPAALEAYLSMKEALSKGSLDPQLRELIAIVVAETNGCEYCLSAHVALGQKVGLSDEQLKMAREIRSADPKVGVALAFCRDLLLRRRELPDKEVDDLREAGYTDGEIAEIIANVAANWYGNYFNMLAKTEIDFPKVPLAFPA